MPNRTRPDPIIPDHEVLRKIGGGAYGEVWLARGVTGALRAVKIVWREDFEDARGFEREFEGILKFEPISRDHPGLVNILHVGRSPDGTSFYYYVMELGDDVRSGADINPVEYEPRTLRADSKISAGTRMETGLCIDVGLRLSEALDHLHERGLAHRDVKPANVIFVNGKAKLADIGLVATRDQRTFVGTEGFVPPEGPGSAQADVYSLGKVLYEIATGKDRLDFPELPDELPPVEERKRWLELNKVICDTCDPHISRRKIRTAAELAEALRRLQRGKRRRRSGMAAWMTSLVLGGFVVFGGWEVVKDAPWVKDLMVKEPLVEERKSPKPPRMGQIRIVSFPEGADVLGIGDEPLGVTPLDLKVPVGTEVEYKVIMNHYAVLPIRETVPESAVGSPLLLGGPLKSFTPPGIGEPWENRSVRYIPEKQGHVSSTYVGEAAWIEFANKTKLQNSQTKFLKASENGKTSKVAAVSRKDAEAFCDWLRDDAIQGGRLSDKYEMIPRFEAEFNDPSDPAGTEAARAAGLHPFRVFVRLIPYGRITVGTNPSGATVLLNGRFVGNTTVPLEIERIKPGPFTLSITLEGYKPVTFDEKSSPPALMEPEGFLPFNVNLQENKGVRFDRPWKNSLGMQFVPVTKDLMVSAYETRISEYDEFRKAEPRKAGGKVVTKEDMKSHPVSDVTRNNARDFCVWLTQRDRNDQLISAMHEYRLPTDWEWSLIAGLNEPANHTPEWRDVHAPHIFPWGPDWPPPEKFANLADVSADGARGMQPSRAIPGYKDGFERSAPVGSFPPSYVTFNDKRYEIYDLCGNVYEWVSDDLKPVAQSQKPGAPAHTPYGVLRGGSWSTFQPANLYTGYRNAVPPTVSDDIYGFRVVLAKIPFTEENSSESETDPDHG
ncbi:SUMF1/EgtB/PvdO family nonheme iron enzyme [Luteolibacter ambystomatis]|uniref:SUMF1/EgtB/PvdO family nonheme iron enzyme n=1 Tax=Luteolibacter ambystomatis TaxID=2824561 RepID=A0A975PG22_9BACT|nr:SUMF1/EgtB/PvdO family nonheme iron enzyme [Luteolibacter ambystomatis]QUE52388.1 SUMF1/EgtB/PvdO family nonheme iron enzyme [Luteolibacter ambystomatis]